MLVIFHWKLIQSIGTLISQRKCIQILFYYYFPCSLEAKFLEKVRWSSSLLLTGNSLLVKVPVLKDLLQSLLNINLFRLINQVSLIYTLFQIHINSVSGGEDVTNIDVFNKGLHGSRSLLNLLFGHAAGDLTRTTGNSSNEAVWELLFIRSIIEGLDYYGFLSCETSSKDNNYLSAFCEEEKR